MTLFDLGSPWQHRQPQTPVSAKRLNDREQAIVDQINAQATRLSSVESNKADWAKLQVNVKNYGAVGDGTTDDTTALGNAETVALILGAEKYHPASTYSVTQLNYTTGSRWIGDGKRASVFKMRDATANDGVLKAIARMSGAAATDFSFRKLGFYGNRANSNHSTESIFGIHTQDAQRFTIADCEFRNFRGEGVYVGRSSGTISSEFTIADNDFYDCGKKEGGDGGNTRQGVAVIAGKNLTISRNIFSDIGSYAIDLEANASGQTFDNVNIIGNVIDTVVDGALNVAPQVDGEATNINVIGNTLRGSAVSFALIRAAGANVIGNVAVSCTGKSLRLVGASSNVTISGNTLKTSGTGAGNADVYLDAGSNRCTVSGNGLLNTSAVASIKEEAGCDNNVFLANEYANANPWTTTGAATATDVTLRRALTVAAGSITISPGSGGATLTLGGTSGNISSGANALNTDGSQTIMKASGTEGFRVTTASKVQIGQGTAIAKHISGTVTWDPPSVANAAETTTTVTVTGAALGDTVVVGFSVSLAGMKLTGYVSATNTVTVVLRNDTGGALDLASGTLRADVWQH